MLLLGTYIDFSEIIIVPLFDTYSLIDQAMLKVNVIKSFKPQQRTHYLASDSYHKAFQENTNIVFRFPIHCFV